MRIDAQRVGSVNPLFASRIIARGLPFINPISRAIGSVAETERKRDVPLDAEEPSTCACSTKPFSFRDVPDSSPDCIAVKLAGGSVGRNPL